MMGRNHVLVGLGLGALALFTLRPIASAALPAVALSAVAVISGALAPDLDHAHSSATHRVWGRGCLNWLAGGFFRKLTGGHRKGTHSIWALALLAAGLYWLLHNAPGNVWAWPAYAFGLGYASHIFADLPTEEGVFLFWPLWPGAVHLLPRFLRFRSGSWVEYALVAALWVGGLVRLLIHY